MLTNSSNHRPTLPVELSYQILEQAWHLPLSTTERRDLLVSLPLVCTSFHWIANCLFLRDAHVVSPTYATHLLTLLQRRIQLSSHTNTDGPPSSPDAPARSTCQSITFHLYDPSTSPDHLHLHLPSSNTTFRALETTLRALSRDASLAPALRRIALCYAGLSFTHELEHPRLALLPPQVRTLELRFATPAPFAPRLRELYVRRCALPMPGVRSLEIYGACPAFVADVARACPALESLQTDDAREVLALQPSLRPFMPHGVGDGAQAEGPVASPESMAKKNTSSEWYSGIREKRETKLRDLKRGARAYLQ